MSILKRIGNKMLVKGTPPVAAIPPWTEYRPDPPATQSTQNSLLAFGVIGGIPTTAVPQQTMPSSGGGSMGGGSSYSYSATSHNGVPGNYIVKVNADGSYEVIRR